MTAADQLTDPSARFIFRNAAESGLFEATYASSEALTLAARRSTASTFQKINPIGKHGVLLHRGGQVMQTVEEFHRLAAFVRHFDEDAAQVAVRSGNLEQVVRHQHAAADMVNAVHFDYQNLSLWEEKFKTVIPFFVWMRRNLPLQMSALVEKPQMITRYMHLVNAANEMFDSRDQDLGPRRYGGQSFVGTDIVLNEDTPFWAQLILDPDIPVKDLFAIEDPLSPSSYVNLAISMLGPQISEPIKLLNEDSYDVSAPVGWQMATRGYNALTSGGIDTSTRVDSRAAALMRTLFPPASEYLTAFETDDKRLQERGLAPDPTVWDRLKVGAADLVLPGLGVDTYTPAEQYALGQSSKYSQQQWLTDMRKRGVLTPEIEEMLASTAKQQVANDPLAAFR